jgi:tetratricopeptide (TPR) repeat protein
MARFTSSRAAFAFAAALALAGCGASSTRYYIGTFEQNQELRELFGLLSTEKEDKNRFVLIQQIGHSLANSGKLEKEILFLTTHVDRNPADVFNAYYLLMAAEAYRELDAVPLAIHYYLRILKNHVDLFVGGQSIHLHCLQELIDLESRPEYRIEYFKELISRFGAQSGVNLGSAYYFLARAYDEVGEWPLAVQSYQRFLDSSDTEIPGEDEAYLKALEKVGFYFSADKSWTVPDLDTLVSGVKDAIFTKNVQKLRKYQAKVNFFAKGWEQSTATGDADGASDADGTTASNIGLYLLSSNPKIEGRLDVTSNEKAAYLKTTGWRFRPPTWYLFFRKVDFPADPEINGQWEWAGIYFGEKL